MCLTVKVVMITNNMFITMALLEEDIRDAVKNCQASSDRSGTYDESKDRTLTSDNERNDWVAHFETATNHCEDWGDLQTNISQATVENGWICEWQDSASSSLLEVGTAVSPVVSNPITEVLLRCFASDPGDAAAEECPTATQLLSHMTSHSCMWHSLLDGRELVQTCPLCVSRYHSSLRVCTSKSSVVPPPLPTLSGDWPSFDWSTVESPTDVNLVPSLFRPGKPDSPVGIDFDHNRATLGLSMLSELELKTMCQEMLSKFNRLSVDLVCLLERRDRLISELDTKNRFISAMLRVQAVRHNSNVGTNGPVEGLSIFRARSWSLISKATPDEKPSSTKFVEWIIPYMPPKDTRWTAGNLQLLTKILNAIVEDSASVPALVTDYIQEQVLERDGWA